MTQQSFEEIDKIALGFAQALSVTESSTSKIHAKAMKMAFNWIDTEEERRKQFCQHYPNWQKLDSESFKLLESGKSYWVISELEGNKRQLGYYEFDQDISNFSSENGYQFIDDQKLGIIGEYFISTDDAKIFNKDFEPNYPQNLAKDFTRQSIYANIG